MALKPNQIKYLLLGAGGLGLALRVLLYITGTDAAGLLIRGHWAEILLWILTAAVAGGILLLTRQLSGPDQYRAAFPPSLISAAGACAAAVALFLSPSPEAPGSTLATAESVMRIAAGLALPVIGFCRFRGSKPSFLLHSVVCLYLALRLVCQYRYWSADPQLQDYCFYLGAYVALMLTAYQFAAFDAGLGSHRKLWGTGLASVYLCVLSLWGTAEPLLMLCCGFWVFTNLSSLKQPRKRSTANETAPTTEQQEEDA